MRNFPIHTYFDVDIDRVWDTVISDLPPLIAQIEQLILILQSAHDSDERAP
jgi:uncharacterized protein with HEPN domain